MSELSLESVIREKLTGDAQKNALDLVDFLKANKVGFCPYDQSGEGWVVDGVADDSTGFLMVNGVDEIPGPWTLWFSTCDFGDAGTINDDLKETVWANISPCGKCHDGWEECVNSGGGGDNKVFGKSFGLLCHSPLMFTNPDEKTLKGIKELLLICKDNQK